jgi:hypothetical protein
MKIPDNEIASIEWRNAWEVAAAQISMETGIFVSIKSEYGTQSLSGFTSTNYSKLARICFVLDGHEFETLKDLRKAIANKAFL